MERLHLRSNPHRCEGTGARFSIIGGGAWELLRARDHTRRRAGRGAWCGLEARRHAGRGAWCGLRARRPPYSPSWTPSRPPRPTIPVARPFETPSALRARRGRCGQDPRPDRTGDLDPGLFSLPPSPRSVHLGCSYYFATQICFFC
jgi:hypothetical protein